MTIPIETWVLPRPRKPYYPGSFPLFFEQKLWKLLGSPKRVLHPFGGFAEIGDKVDLNLETKPTWFGDAHNLFFIPDNAYDLVICDPPYNDKLSEEMYHAPKLHYKKWMNEAVRVCKPNGYIASYNWIWTTKPLGTEYFKIIVVLLGQHHRARICCIYRKNNEEEN
jgi:hypothetical protein